MSIRPVDFNRVIQNTPEAQNQEVTVKDQPNIQQQNIAVTFQRETTEAETRVNEKADTAETGGKITDEGRGNGSGYTPQKREKKKKVRMSDGSVRVKNEHGSFDMKI